MKKKTLVVLLIGMMIVSVFTGCGKTKEQKYSEQLQRELGLTKEEADEMAGIAAAMEEAEKAEEERIKKEKEEKSSFKLVEPSPEIINSKITDPIVQVGNAVIPNDGSLTIGELKDILEKESGAKTVIAYDGHNPNRLDMNFRMPEFTEASLVKSTYYDCGYYVAYKDENDNEICRAIYVNDTDVPIAAFDCKIACIYAPSGISMNILNFFYAGNICAGTYAIISDIRTTDAYKERISEYPAMTYQNVEECLLAAGAERVYNINNDTFQVYEYSKLDDFDEKYRCKEYYFLVDMNTSLVNEIRYSFKIDSASGCVERNVLDISLIDSEIISNIETFASKELSDEWFKNKADSKVTVDGFFIVKEGYSEFICVVCYTDRGTYEPISIELHRQFDGKYSAERNYNINRNSSDEPFTSAEEIIEEYGADFNDYVPVK